MSHSHLTELFSSPTNAKTDDNAALPFYQWQQATKKWQLSSVFLNSHHSIDINPLSKADTYQYNCWHVNMNQSLALCVGEDAIRSTKEALLTMSSIVWGLSNVHGRWHMIVTEDVPDSLQHLFKHQYHRLHIAFVTVDDFSSDLSSTTLEAVCRDLITSVTGRILFLHKQQYALACDLDVFCLESMLCPSLASLVIKRSETSPPEWWKPPLNLLPFEKQEADEMMCKLLLTRIQRWQQKQNSKKKKKKQQRWQERAVQTKVVVELQQQFDEIVVQKWCLQQEEKREEKIIKVEIDAEDCAIVTKNETTIIVNNDKAMLPTVSKRSQQTIITPAIKQRQYKTIHRPIHIKRQRDKLRIPKSTLVSISSSSSLPQLLPPDTNDVSEFPPLPQSVSSTSALIPIDLSQQQLAEEIPSSSRLVPIDSSQQWSEGKNVPQSFYHPPPPPPLPSPYLYFVPIYSYSPPPFFSPPPMMPISSPLINYQHQQQHQQQQQQQQQQQRLLPFHTIINNTSKRFTVPLKKEVWSFVCSYCLKPTMRDVAEPMLDVFVCPLCARESNVAYPHLR
jgi:hypothetical protein